MFDNNQTVQVDNHKLSFANAFSSPYRGSLKSFKRVEVADHGSMGLALRENEKEQDIAIYTGMIFEVKKCMVGAVEMTKLYYLNPLNALGSSWFYTKLTFEEALNYINESRQA